MPRMPCSFREADVRRAIKATLSSGMTIGRVEVGRNGTIVIFPGQAALSDDLDRELAEFKAQHGQD